MPARSKIAPAAHSKWECPAGAPLYQPSIPFRECMPRVRRASSARPVGAIAAGLAPAGRRAAGLWRPAHADAQVAKGVHAQLHLRIFSRTRRILNVYALAFLSGSRAAAGIKQRHAEGVLRSACGRKQRHSSVTHISSSFGRNPNPTAHHYVFVF